MVLGANARPVNLSLNRFPGACRAIDKVVLLACGRWASSPKARAYRALQRLRQFLRP